MAYEDDFIILRTLDDAMRRLKNQFKTFFTKLTNAQKIMFQTINNQTISIRDAKLLPIKPCPMILPFPLSSKVMYPYFLLVRKANFDSSSVMCLEQPLSKNNFSFFDPHKRKLRSFRYQNIFESLVLGD